MICGKAGSLKCAWSMRLVRERKLSILLNDRQHVHTAIDEADHIPSSDDLGSISRGTSIH